MATSNSGGGYEVYENTVLNENNAPITGNALMGLSCVFCKLLLHHAYQLPCGDRACESCMPKKIFSCPRCDEPDINPSLPKICYPDKSCRMDMKSLRVVCRCSQKIALMDWENHCNSCAEVEHMNHTHHSLQGTNRFPDGKSIEECLQHPEPELGPAQQKASRNPAQTLQQEDKLGNFLKTASANKSVTLHSNPVSSPQDDSPPSGISTSQMVVPQPPTVKEEPWDLDTYIKPGCSPKVLAIINANDSSYYNGEFLPTPITEEGPPLDAVMTVNVLKPALLACGFAVIDVVNRSKNSLYDLFQLIIQQGLPKSIELIIFISSTHGKCDQICMNHEYIGIPHMVQHLTKIDCPNFFCIFEGCQRGPGSLSIGKVDKSYAVMYSVPPQSFSYHLDGVGILTRCLAKLLTNGPYVNSIKELVEDLRYEVDRKLKEIEISSEDKPISVYNSIPNVNFHSLTSALIPQVNHVSRQGVMVTLDVSVPKRLSHHPNFELKELQVVITEGGRTKDVLARDTKEYDALWKVTVELPLRADRCKEGLKVVACYEGRKEYSRFLGYDQPVLDLPKILSCKRNNCKMDITFIAKQEFNTDSGQYDVSSIWWRCLPNEEWALLQEAHPSDNEQTCTVTVPLSYPGDNTTYRVQIRKRYAAADINMDSDSVDITAELPKLDSPKIVSCKRNNCKIDITFIAKQEFHTDSGEYDVSSVQWRCCFPNGEWTQLSDALPSDNEQTCTVTVPHSNPDDNTACTVQIRKCYDASGIITKSDLLDITAKLPKLSRPSEPHVTRVFCCSRKKVTFRVDKCCDQFQVRIANSGVKYWTRDADDPDADEPKHCLATVHDGEEHKVEAPFEAIKLKPFVEYHNGVEVLGGLLETQNTQCQEHVQKMRNYSSEHRCLTCCYVCCGLAILFLSLVIFAPVGLLVTSPTMSTTDVIVSNTTINHPLLDSTTWRAMLYERIDVALYAKPPSDNPNITVSIFKAYDMKLRSLKFNISDSSYIILSGGKQCQYLNNEFGNPTYFVKGSNITGTASIHLPNSKADNLHSAMLLGVTSYFVDINERCFDTKRLQPILSINLSLANGKINQKLTTQKVAHDSYLYFVLQTDASSQVKVSLNLELDILYYPGLNDMLTGSYKIIDNVSSTHNASVPIRFATGTTYYMFAGDVGERALRIIHLNITLVRRTELEMIGMGTVGSVLALLIFFCFCCTVLWRKCETVRTSESTDHIINTDPRDMNDPREIEPLLKAENT